MKSILTFFIFSLVSIGAFSQEFQFGVKAAYLASQVDGDRLKGFHKSGYSLAVLGGYALNPKQWIVVECGYNQFGSQIKNESGAIVNGAHKDFYEWKFNTVSVLFGFSQKIGDTWDGSSRFRISGGIRGHGIISKELNVIQRGPTGGGESVNKNDTKDYMFSANFALGMMIKENIAFDLSFDHSLGNLLERESNLISSVRPYYLSLGISYYLRSGK